MTRIRHVVRLGPSPSEIRDVGPDDDVSFVPMEAIADGVGGLDPSGVKPLGQLKAGSYNYFADGDILLAKVTPCFENGKKAIAADLINGVGFATSEVHVLRPDTRKVDRRFLLYVLGTEDFRYRGVVSMTGAGGLKRISEAAILDHRIVVENIDDQRAIAAFLDTETARIDALLDRKERFSNLIVAREEASFLDAVRGADIRGPRFASGVRWIGDLPEGWLAPKFTHVARQETGHTPSRKELSYWVPEDCVIPWVSLADVWQLRSGDSVFIEDTSEKISEIGMANSAARLLPANTVILSRTASVGFAGILEKPMATTQDFAAWICGSTIRPKYLYYVLRAMKPEFRRLMIGSTHQTIYMPDIRAFRTPLPPLTEQDRIVSSLDGVIGAYRKVKSQTAKTMSRLREFRSAVITAAVNGQIDPEAWRRRGDTDRRLDRIEADMAVEAAE